MDSLQHTSSNHDEADILQAMHLASISSLPFALKVAVDLGLLEIISKAHTPSRMLSAAEIVSQLPANNPDAPSIVDRILRLLATHSILTCNQITGQDGQTQRSYGLSSVGKYFLQNEDGISFAPLQRINLEKYIIECWKFLKDVVLEGGFSCEKAFGKHLFQLLATDDEMSKTFNRAMSVYTDLVMNKVLETYKGFEGVSQVVDVGGGMGTNLKLIVSKYPQIKGINYDLPQVIKDALPFPGVEHLAGDMFTQIPKAQVIFMKSMLHDWGDELCLKLLKVCYDALPENGKIVLVESIIPEVPETDIITKTIFQRDVALFHILPGAKERSKQEFETLAKQAGFSSLEVVCRAYNFWVMEIYKAD
ncbi:caffeate O-methyltransferase 1, O-methyltransferase 1, O-methyltransferase 3 [Hibiscus trionum]|uniref:Caffeate O-methyltransferase 1, O-methyltransferase 1, O-methyltransferase 3 n=1 Tax=Hibiscus trionum TaxID=183268 RepID=A0A9W7M3Y2_HIBTR|nr:caffeate O-methyltransferase 1, O-methyltransferase 1, O-methyltransferase 3 [Hibiscus trionum]